MPQQKEVAVVTESSTGVGYETSLALAKMASWSSTSLTGTGDDR